MVILGGWVFLMSEVLLYKRGCPALVLSGHSHLYHETKRRVLRFPPVTVRGVKEEVVFHDPAWILGSKSIAGRLVSQNVFIK